MDAGSMPVIVAAKTQESDDVVSLRLVREDGCPLPHWEPGAHVDLRPSNLRIRQYSLAGDPADLSCYLVGVLREPAGSGTSAHLHDRTQVGDRLAMSAPRNHFDLSPALRYVFVAGGIGITPILPMVEAAAASGAQWSLLYGGRALSSMAFRDRLVRHGGAVTMWPQDRNGLPDLTTLFAEPREDTLIYSCGPEPLLQAMEVACAHWPEGALRVERFIARDQPAARTAFDVVLAASGTTLHVPADRSILSVLDEAGVQVTSSCEEGTCGSCETGVLAGVPDHRDAVLGAAARARGDCMMVCVSRALTQSLTLDL